MPTPKKPLDLAMYDGIYYDKTVGNIATSKQTFGVYEEPSAEDFIINRYLIYIGPNAKDEEDTEEIDVEANSEKHARAIAALAIKQDYQPGIKIVKVIRD